MVLSSLASSTLYIAALFLAIVGIDSASITLSSSKAIALSSKSISYFAFLLFFNFYTSAFFSSFFDFGLTATFFSYFFVSFLDSTTFSDGFLSSYSSSSSSESCNYLS
jgi:hypothetical protein